MITSLEPILSSHPFFHGLPESYLQLIAGCASNVRFEAGEKIFQSGEAANTFYIIRGGRVTVDIFIPGRGDVTIETLTEGEVLGLSWLFPPYIWRFNSRAMELTRAIALDGKCLRTKCEADPSLGYELLKRISSILMQRLEVTSMQLLDIYGTGKKS
jgi:CRP/FNR family transcriptional regulator, cyclic AMP receptor protein